MCGGGGREHALGWAWRRDDENAELWFAPGNGGTGELGTNLDIAADDAVTIAREAREGRVDLVVVGPDAALAAGVVDACAAVGIPCFGPTSAAARLESSKHFAKSVMHDAGVATADYVAVTAESLEVGRAFIRQHQGRCVIKADGLALGKGVQVCEGSDDAEAALRACVQQRRFAEAGDMALVEERLEGREVSVFAIADGRSCRMLGAACDYKRAFDGDKGPNTGGMGAYSPPAGLDLTELIENTRESVVKPVLAEMYRRRTPFRGCLYVGLMLTSEGARVLEFNARFGDPETQALLPLTAESLPALLWSAARGELVGDVAVRMQAGASVCVVATTAPYPDGGGVGVPISLPDGGAGLLFHAGTRAIDGHFEVAGGRVLNAVGLGETLGDARAAAYQLLEGVSFEGIRYRRDIGQTTF